MRAIREQGGDMPGRVFKQRFIAYIEKIPLRLVLIVPFVVEIVVVVGLTGYLSFRNGKEVVADIAFQLLNEISVRISLDMRKYLAPSYEITQLNGHENVNFSDPEKLQQRFWHQLHAFKSTAAIFAANEEKGFVGVERYPDGSEVMTVSGESTNYAFHTYAADDQGNKLKLLKESKNYDPRIRPYYKAAVAAGTQTWTDIYPFALHDTLYISVVHPVYDTIGRLEGVVACAQNLQAIREFLRSIKAGSSGTTFILERSGLLVATSTTERLFRGKEYDYQRIHALESQEPIIRAASQYLETHFRGFNQIIETEQRIFDLDGEQLFLQVEPFRDGHGIHWLSVVVIPAIDFMERIASNNRMTIIVILVALLVAICIGFLTAQWIIRPILRLNMSAKALAEGKWEQQLTGTRRSDELGELARSFLHMAAQLQELFARLETRVKERTAELVVAKEHAESANRAKSVFLANMSHELRTPLNTILGFSQLMTHHPELPREMQEHLSIIQQSGEHLLNLINQVLDLSKIEAGRLSLSERDFDLHLLLDDLQNMFSLKVRKKGLSLTFEREDDVPRWVRSDELKLRQILINLLNNAVKFTGEGGIMVHVDARSPGGTEPEGAEKASPQATRPTLLVFEISDTGSGIAGEDMDRLFEAFAQLERGRYSQDGTGLGLPISRKFAQVMGGDISVKSELGRGTTFLLHIQAGLTEHSAIAEQHSALRKRAIALEPGQPLYNMLIVDDVPNNRQLLVKLLSPFGFALREAENGREAVEIWEEWRPHLIWMDIRMPMLDGYEAAKKIRELGTGSREPIIIALSASVFEEERLTALSKGCDDFLRKPFREADMLELLRKHLGVRFVYEEEAERDVTPEPQAEVLNPDALAALPEALLAKLEYAALTSDMREISVLTAEIRRYDALIADAVAYLADHFGYPEILTALRQRASRQETDTIDGADPLNLPSQED